MSQDSGPGRTAIKRRKISKYQDRNVHILMKVLKIYKIDEWPLEKLALQLPWCGGEKPFFSPLFFSPFYCSQYVLKSCVNKCEPGYSCIMKCPCGTWLNLTRSCCFFQDLVRKWETGKTRERRESIPVISLVMIWFCIVTKGTKNISRRVKASAVLESVVCFWHGFCSYIAIKTLERK